ncbi:MAG: co-chaperone YbbN [Gammaproteobacteria bacterium]
MHSIDVSERNFQLEVIEKSKSVPVVVDFWAPWCGPCQTLKPILEKLAEEYQGKFVLAKVNSDENQQLSTQFGVRGIPSVKAVCNGQIVNEFSGALPESAVREFLDSIIPNESEIKRQAAMNSYDAGDNTAALALLDQAILLDGNNHTAKINKAMLLVENNDTDSARALIAELPANIQQDESVKELATKIELNERINHLPDKQTLLQQIQQDESNLQARIDLASHDMNDQSYEEAFELLFDVIRKDRNFGDGIARSTLLSVFTLIGPQDPRVRAARKTLASLLN